jgi:TrmH family RNA methyltransferase
MPGMDQLITSAANPLVKRIRALADRKHRRREGAFVVEGLQPVWRAVTAGWQIDTLVVSPDLLTNERARAMVAQQQDAGVPVARLGAEVFTRISDRDGPTGLLAIVRGAVPDVSAFRPPATGPVVALHRAGNPGNVGTIVRTADAAGAAGVLLVEHGADPLAPSAVKASMGSVFAVPMAHASDVEEMFDWAAQQHRAVVAVTGHTARSLWSADLPADAVLLLGSEGDGLPDDVAARCAAQVAIPMVGTAESLNLATAASVILYEMVRRRPTTRAR